MHLRVSDILLTEDQLRRALASAGWDESMAAAWGSGLRWRAEFDKVGYLDFSPMNETLVEVLGAHVRRRAGLGEAWAFPGNTDTTEPLDKQMASYYLRQAEKLAGLTHQKRGGWHAFRRAWATRRKHLPVQDVMKAGGWRDVKALQAAYQQSDPETVRRVMDIG